MTSVASIPPALKCSRMSPAGTPVRAKRPLLSIVVMMFVPPTVTVIPPVPADDVAETRPVPPLTTPLTVAPADPGAAADGEDVGESVGLESLQPAAVSIANPTRTSGTPCRNIIGSTPAQACASSREVLGVGEGSKGRAANAPNALQTVISGMVKHLEIQLYAMHGVPSV